MMFLHPERWLRSLRLVLTAALLYALTLQGFLVESLHAGQSVAFDHEICAGFDTRSGHAPASNHQNADCAALCAQCVAFAAPDVALPPAPSADYVLHKVAIRHNIAGSLTSVAWFHARGPPVWG